MLSITSATSTGNIDGVIVFDANDPEGGELEVFVDYGDGFSESITSDGGEFTARHDYQTQGEYEVSITATDEQGARIEASTPITVTATVRVTLVEGQIRVVDSCDAPGTDSEFYGTASTLGDSKDYSVTAAVNAIVTLSFGPSQIFTISDPETPSVAISVSVFDNDPGAGDQLIGTYTNLARPLPAVTRDDPVKTTATTWAQLFGPTCSVQVVHRFMVTLLLE